MEVHLMTEVLFLIGRPVPHLLVFGAWLIWMWVSHYQQGKHLWMWELTNWGAIGYGCFLVIGFFAAIFYIDKDIESFKSIVFIIDHAFYWAWAGLIVVGGFNCWLTLTGKKD